MKWERKRGGQRAPVEQERTDDAHQERRLCAVLDRLARLGDDARERSDDAMKVRKLMVELLQTTSLRGVREAFKACDAMYAVLTSRYAWLKTNGYFLRKPHKGNES